MRGAALLLAGAAVRPRWLALIVARTHLGRLLMLHRRQIYLGIFYATGAVGPALGFVLGGVFLSFWVDLGPPPDGVTNGGSSSGGGSSSSISWIGAWWLGFVAMGALAVVVASLLFLFPRRLPGTEQIAQRRRLAPEQHAAAAATHSVRLGARTLWPMLWLLLTQHRTFLFNTLGTTLETMAVGALTVFLPKFVQAQFGLSANVASIVVGLIVIPGAAGGMVTGGWLVRRLRLSGRGTARAVWIISACATLFALTFLVGCPSVPFVGVNAAYGGGSGNNNGLVAPCNAACNCSAPDPPLQPVCGSDGRTYYSACFAGCTDLRPRGSTDPSSAAFTNCSCVALSYGRAGSPDERTATWGLCAGSCDSLGAFLALLFCAMFLTFLNNVPATNVILRYGAA